MHTRRTYSILTIARRHPLLFSRLAQKPAEPAITVLTTARSAGAAVVSDPARLIPGECNPGY